MCETSPDRLPSLEFLELLCLIFLILLIDHLLHCTSEPPAIDPRTLAPHLRACSLTLPDLGPQ